MTGETYPQRASAFMIAGAFVLAMILLAVLFGNVMEDRRNPNRDVETAQLAGGERAVTLRKNNRGHYLASGRINDSEVVFFLDTGASTVAVPTGIAERAGLTRGPRLRLQTANGTSVGYASRIDRLELGGIVLRDVPATIAPGYDSNDVLLGMSVLGQLDFEQIGDTLTLRQSR